MCLLQVRNRLLTLILGLSLLCMSCEAKTGDKAKQSIPPSPVFPTPPTEYMDPQLRASYILNNVFTPYKQLDSSVFLTRAVEEQFWVNYFAIAQAATSASFRKSMTEVFEKGTKDFNHQLIGFVDEYLYQVNSPVYNESMYIQVLQIADSLSILNEGEKILYEDRFKMYNKNKVGALATDFTYTTPDGRTHSLHRTTGSQTLIVFYNPGCDVCRQVLQHIDQSVIVNKAIDNGLKVLCISVTGEEDEWRGHMKEIPQRAIVGIDKSGDINRESLYDIKAFPTLYLLDKDKKVIAKDPMIQQVEQILAKIGE